MAYPSYFSSPPADPDGRSVDRSEASRIGSGGIGTPSAAPIVAEKQQSCSFTSKVSGFGHSMSGDDSGARGRRGTHVSAGVQSLAGHSTVIGSVKRVATSIVEDLMTLNEPGKHADPDRPINPISITFNLIQSTCGVGILSLATTFAYSGIIIASGAFIAVGIITYHSIKLLLDALLLTGATSYENLGERCIGPPGRIGVQSCVFGLCFMALCAYLVSLKAFVWLVLEQIVPDDHWQHFTDHGGSKNTLMVGAVLLIVLPLSLTRRIDALARTSIIGFFCVLFFVGLSTYYLGHYAKDGVDGLVCHERDDDSDNSPTGMSLRYVHFTPIKILSALSIIGASFACHFTVFPAYREARVAEPEDRAAKKVLGATALAMILVTPLYILAAFSGYYVWRDIAPKASSVLACYPTSEAAVAICYVGMSVTLISAYPLVCFSTRYTLATVVFRGGDPGDLSYPRHAAITIALAASSTGVSCLTDSLGTVLSVGSAFFTPGVCYILPALCFINARKMALRNHDDEEGVTPSGYSELDGGVEDGCGGLLQHRRTVTEGSAVGGYVLLAIGIVFQIGMITGSMLNLFV
eukprot:TRINITY_DN2166_c0_g5_i1.p1 TRINITY_DN2166_c0_g5~~TRINITY_DN2166_c0_g5_i1.p1  ORF type:complete len:602 (+),score=181.29 TRINITY_DN2166_c0_g5_i1:71-1807(+)